ncbi:MAG TPA: polyprenyl synthetase family protein [Candidatus Saccharimonadaceae bacterium]|nr:polyprenyl synthetase family protein [Candidatus Saccharimonadaceae bacterium]
MNNPSHSDFLEALSARMADEARDILEKLHAQESLGLFAGGKWLRSQLAYVLHAKYGDQFIEQTLAMELLHVSTLVHDDVIDHAELRRGESTISNIHGDGTGILAGDLLMMRSLEIAQKSMPAWLHREFVKTYEGICIAQNDELMWRGKLRTQEQYEKVSLGKTGLLYGFAAKLGCGASEGAAAYEKIVQDIAYAFQIVDDIDDMVTWLGDDTAHASKRAELDVELGNYTLPVILAFEKKKFAGPASIVRVSKSEWQKAILESHMVAKTVLEKAEHEIGNLPDSRQKTAFMAWAEPMIDQLEAKSATIDTLRI